MRRLIILSFILLPFVSTQSDSVERLPGFDGPLKEKQYAGHITVNQTYNSNLFYWFFEHIDGKSDSVPLILWLNGGPGCSSMTGLFGELGPYKFSGDNTLVENPYGWNRVGHLIFIDQPVGVGLSTTSDGGYATNEDIVSDQLYQCLVGFFKLHPEYSKSKMILSGESYAGKYIPALTQRILAANKDPKQVHIDLFGIAIGDGLVDGLIQRLIKPNQVYWSGIMGYQQLQNIKPIQSACIRYIQNGQTTEEGSPCEKLQEYISTVAGPGLNTLDLRIFSPTYNATAQVNYLNRPDIQSLLHLKSRTVYESCSDVVYKYLREDILVSYKHLIRKFVVDDGIKTLLYNGNFDLQDGPYGTEQYLLSLKIPGFKQEPRDLWVVNGKTSGYVTTVGKLTFLSVSGAGHFLPADQPINALEMMRTFINEQAFCDPLKEFQFDNNKASRSCRVTQDLCRINNCNQKGDCDPNTGTCNCDDDVTGPDCSHKLFRVSNSKHIDMNRDIAQRDWVYYKATAPQSDSFSIFLNVTQKGVGVPFEGDDESFDTVIGGGIGGINQPRTGLCVFASSKALPTEDNYDLIRCVDGLKPVVLRSIVHVNASSYPEYYFAIFNAHPYQVSYSMTFSTEKVIVRPSFVEEVFVSKEFWIPMGVSLGVIVLLCLLCIYLLVLVRRKSSKYTGLN
ncbi:serine carboxypeptidase [Acrasis kona]|uniref:Carboxypeptidase n=1 Tax=Acrasis kona TaxID=1008807 RepID=A0AAW2ZI16_9EUKA